MTVRHKAIGILVALLLVAFASACGTERGPQHYRAPIGKARGPIDEYAGSYGGVRLGATRSQVTAALGRPLPRRPRGIPSSLPSEIYSHGHLFFPDVQIEVGDNWGDTVIRRNRVSAFAVYAPGASTNRGIQVGDSLKRVRQKYPGANCLPDRTLGEYFASAECTVQVGPHRHVFFDQDPVQTINVSTHGFGAPLGS